MTHEFIMTDSGEVNTAHIVLMYADDKSDPQSTRIVLSNGDRVNARGHVEDLASRLGSVFPAYPGFTLLWLFIDRGANPRNFDFDGAIWRDPIIAWRLVSSLAPVPVTVDGDQETGRSAEGDRFAAVLAPTGVVYEQEAATYRNIGDWIERVRKAWTDEIDKGR